MLGVLCSPVGQKPAGFLFRTPTNSTEFMRGLGRVQPDCLATMFGVRDHHHSQGSKKRFQVK